MHPQSIVHGLVEFRDGSVIAQLGSPDMRIPIAHCLAWPDRIDGRRRGSISPAIASLTFEEPDLDRFPALALARAALEQAAAPPTVLNAANEIAVAEFLGRIGLDLPAFPRWSRPRSRQRRARGVTREPASIEDALAVDHRCEIVGARPLARNCRKGIVMSRAGWSASSRRG